MIMNSIYRLCALVMSTIAMRAQDSFAMAAAVVIAICAVGRSIDEK